MMVALNGIGCGNRGLRGNPREGGDKVWWEAGYVTHAGSEGGAWCDMSHVQ